MFYRGAETGSPTINVFLYNCIPHFTRCFLSFVIWLQAENFSSEKITSLPYRPLNTIKKKGKGLGMENLKQKKLVLKAQCEGLVSLFLYLP